MKRKLYLSTLLLPLIIIALISGCGDDKPKIVTEKGSCPESPIVLNIGVNDPLCKACACDCVGDEATRSFDDLTKLLEKHTGSQVKIHYYPELFLLNEDLKSGKINTLICKAWDGMRLTQKLGMNFARLADIVRPEETQGLHGSFVVLSKSSIKELDDLKGKKLIYGSKGGYEKHYAAINTLKDVGIDVPPEEDMYVASGCKTALIDLIENKGEAAIVSDYAIRDSSVKSFADPAVFRVIGQTQQAIPFITFMISEKAPKFQREAIVKTLLMLTEDRVSKEQFFNGWIAPVNWNPAEL